MWTKERFLEAMAHAPRLCVLLLTRDADGLPIVQTLRENGSLIPCRKARDEKTAVRRMAQVYRRTADNSRCVTIAHTDEFAAAVLAGQLDRNISFEPLDPALAELAIVYSGSLRSSPLV